MVYPGIRRSVKAQELDRAAWADVDIVVAHFDLDSAASQLVDVDFKTVFDGQPFFYYTAELREGQVLVPSDFPVINVAIGSWNRLTPESNIEAPLYIGASVMLSITSVTQYAYHFQLAFRGIVYRNVRDLRA